MRLKPLLILLSLLLAIPASAQRPDRRRGGGGPGGGESSTERSDGQSDRKGGVQDYDKVILEDFKSDSGLFIVHRGDDKVFYEIPQSALGKDMLWVTQIAKTQAGFGYGGTGVGNRVVRWELSDEKVLLRDIKYRIRNQDQDTVRNAVEATSLAPIIQVFPVKAWGKDKNVVIDVTGLFMDDLQEFSAKRSVNGSGVDKNRTFIEEVKSFPENIEAKVLMTYRLSSSSPTAGGESRRRGGGVRRDPTQSAVTVLLHHSMVKLPDNPMAPRERDDRVGFFGVSFEDYDGTDHEVETVRYISRWRLEKKDPSADVSDPVKPIVFYVGRGVPEKWRPWLHKGIEMWQPAFEAAGFSNAIIAKDAPSVREDSDWDAEDARYSSIRWLPSTTENAMGPHVSDPRTGEILESDILVYHNVLKLIRDWYFIQASPNDPAAQKLPLADETIGRALAYVIAHEVGHTLGFPHNMKASSTYTVEQLRDAEFTAEFGTEASIMDYGRFNYVAQPGDGATLIPLIGPYDKFAVEWGYRQYADADQEKQGQAELLAKQVHDPMLRFGDPNPGEDPSQQTEDLGADPIGATAMGLKNLDRVAAYLVDACCDEGEDYSLLDNMYGQLIGQRNRELMHVANIVGGVNKTNLRFGDADQVYFPVEAKQQAEAVAFLNKHAFQTPESLINPEILLRLEAGGAPDRILSSQKRLLQALISSARVKRMSEQAARITPDQHYSPLTMLGDLRLGIWSELEADPSSTDLYRRNLQRAHVEILAEQLGDEFPDTDLPALARGELTILLNSLQGLSRNRRGGDTSETDLHYADLAARIQAVLNPLSQKRPEISASLSPRAGN
ncbi:MAG: zinc-dependent metalloprotease [Planctomycetes bacterium]|nr:zinc-dependent metalloprotease [Planctomycetota bacterium]